MFNDARKLVCKRLTYVKHQIDFKCAEIYDTYYNQYK